MGTLSEHSSSIVALHEQPKFPLEDLSENNLDILSYIFAKESGVATRGLSLCGDSQGILRDLAINATGIIRGKQVSNSEVNYSAFSGGYADAEATYMVMHPKKVFSRSLAARRMRDLLINTGELVDIELNERQEEWQDKMPNTVWLLTSNHADESPASTQVRLFGGFVALELQRQDPKIIIPPPGQSPGPYTTQPETNLPN